MNEPIGFGYSSKEEVKETYIPLEEKTVELKIYEPKIGETVAYVFPNGKHCFTGVVTKIILRGSHDTLYKLEDTKDYCYGYSSGIVKVEDIPPQQQLHRKQISLFN